MGRISIGKAGMSFPGFCGSLCDLSQEGEICGRNDSGRNCPAQDGAHGLRFWFF